MFFKVIQMKTVFKCSVLCTFQICRSHLCSVYDVSSYDYASLQTVNIYGQELLFRIFNSGFIVFFHQIFVFCRHLTVQYFVNFDKNFVLRKLMNPFQCSEALLVIHYKVKLVPCVFWQALNFSSKTKIDKKKYLHK